MTPGQADQGPKGPCSDGKAEACQDGSGIREPLLQAPPYTLARGRLLTPGGGPRGVGQTPSQLFSGALTPSVGFS